MKKNWRVAKSIFVCEDRNKAKEYALGNGSPYVFYYKQLRHLQVSKHVQMSSMPLYFLS